MLRRNQAVIAALILIFCLAFLVRVYPLQQYRGWDESSYLQLAESVANGKANYDEFAYRPPLVPLVLALTFFFWHSPVIAGVVTAALAALVVVAAFLLARQWHSSEAGLIAALLLAVHPVFVSVGHLILTDEIVVTLALFGWYLAYDDDWWRLLLSGLFIGLASMTKFTAIGLLPGLGLWMLWRDRKAPHWRSVLFSLGFLLSFGTYTLWVKSTYGHFFATITHAQFLLPTQGPGVWYYFTLLIFTPALLVGVLLAVLFWRATLERKEFLLVGAWWVGFLFTYLSRLPVKDDRYILIAIAPLFILAGMGYVEGLRALSRRFSVVRHESAYFLSAFVLLLLISSPASYAKLNEAPLNTWIPPAVETSQHIMAINHPEWPVYATTDYPVLGYYTTNKVVVVDGPAFLNAYPRNMAREGFLVINKGRTLMPTQEWAAQQAALELLFENDGYLLYHYVPPQRR